MYNASLFIEPWISEFLSAFGKKFVEEWGIGDIGTEIREGIMQWQHTFFNIGNIPFILTDAIIVTWIAVILVIILTRSMVGKDGIRPNKRQTALYMLVDLMIGVCMGFGMKRDEAERVIPMIGTFGLVIAGCNVISFFKIAPPAKNIAFPAALAVTAIVYVIYISIRLVGFKGFWLSLTTPMKAMLPFKILDFIIKPVSLALRLFGNVFGSSVFMEFLSIIVPIILPAAFGLWFDIADGLLQAVVFSYLTMSYIGEICEVAHEYEEHPENFAKPKKAKKSKKNSADSKPAEATV